ncbi:MAG TPA: ATP-grasp domain-containing protein [Haliangium sp.]|nr:ATP-grasp domain-containing protein [Haliangium sp.]
MNDKQPHVLMIGGRDFQMSCLPELRVSFILFQLEDSINEFQKNVAAELVIIDYTAIEAATQKALQIHAERPFDAVFSFTEFGLLPAASIADTLKVATNCSLEAVLCTRNKLRMREMLVERDFKSIPYARVSSVEELAVFLEKYPRGIILKPIDGVGSQGVFLIKERSEIEAAFKHATKFGAQGLLAEEYVGGAEYSIESLSKSGRHEILAITEKITSGAPHFVEFGHNQPAVLGASEQSLIHRATVSLIEQVGHQTGPCHSEVKLYEGQVYIIETQTRTGGDNIWDMTRITTGADLYKETVAHVLGMETLPRRSTAATAAVRFFKPPAGKLARLHGVKEAASLPGVHELVIKVKEGEQVKEAISSPTRAGYVVTTGPTLESAIAVSRQVMDMVVFSVENGSEA